MNNKKNQKSVGGVSQDICPVVQEGRERRMGKDGIEFEIDDRWDPLSAFGRVLPAPPAANCEEKKGQK